MYKAAKTPFTFGIYPFSGMGTAQGTAVGPPDDMQQIGRAMTELGRGKPMLPRTYVVYAGPRTSAAVLDQIALFARGGLKWDVVLRFQDHGANLNPWTTLIRTIIRRFGNGLGTLQITNEANLKGMPWAADGSNPNTRMALVQGVLAAREEVLMSRATVKIGLSVVPDEDRESFWRCLAMASRAITGDTATFIRALDYVGVDIYPGVFGGQVAVRDLPRVVESTLRQFRGGEMAAAGMAPWVPIRITENGWPTGGAGHDEENQAQALEAVIQTVYGLRRDCNITHYELFGLRDANSRKDDLFHRFGILRDDYSRKPAFGVYQRLIGELAG